MELKKNKVIIFFYNKGSFFISHRLDYAVYLNNKNYKVYLVSNCSKNDIKTLESNGIHLISSLNFRNLNLINFLKNIIFIRKIIKKYNPDICEFASHSMNILGLYGSIFTNTKKIFWITGMGSFFIQKNYFNLIIKFIIINSYRFSKYNKP